MPEQDVEEFLAHYGVKGMRWGVIRDREGSGRRGGSSQKLTKEERAVLKEVGDSEHDSLLRKLKYGPDGEQRKLTPKQKEYLKIAAKVAAGAAVYYGLKVAGERAVVNMTVGKDAPTELKRFWRNYQKPKIPFDFDNLPTDRIELEPGSILTRISSVREKNIRAGGFYAAYKPEDVTRYKAALPIYWKQWGVANDTGHGFQISIRAKNGVKAPSQKEAFEIFNDMMKKRGEVLPSDNKVKGMKFLAAAHAWVDKDDPITKNYFEHLKAWGFNGVLDFNDAGRLGEAPLRLLDSSEFEISKTAKLGTAAIRAAQSTITKVKHMVDDVSDFLAHYGVKGMKWGVRKDRLPRAEKKVRRQARRDYDKSATLSRQGSRSAYARQRRKIVKRMEDPVYAKYSQEAKDTWVKRQLGKAAAQSVLSVSGLTAAWYLTDGRPALLNKAEKAGRLYAKAKQRAGESQVEKFLRKNAFKPSSSLNVIDSFAYESGISKLAALGR